MKLLIFRYSSLMAIVPIHIVPASLYINVSRNSMLDASPMCKSICLRSDNSERFTTLLDFDRLYKYLYEFDKYEVRFGEKYKSVDLTDMRKLLAWLPAQKGAVMKEDGSNLSDLGIILNQAMDTIYLHLQDSIIRMIGDSMIGSIDVELEEILYLILPLVAMTVPFIRNEQPALPL